MRAALNTLILMMLISFGVTAQIPAQTVPEFTFYRFNNTMFTSKDLPKSKMLFFLFFDCDCEHCQRAMENIGRNYQSFKNLTVCLISTDNQSKIIHFADKYGRQLKGQMNVILLQDRGNQFIEKFSPRRYPSMFLYSSEKKLIDYEDNEESVFRFLKLIKETH